MTLKNFLIGWGTKMELTIENTGKFYNNADDWYQAWLIVGEVKTEIGRSYFSYDDCRLNCEKIVKEFSKKGVDIVHSKIYDLMP